MATAKTQANAVPTVVISHPRKSNKGDPPNGMQELVSEWLSQLGLLQLYTKVLFINCLLRTKSHGDGKNRGRVYAVVAIPPNRIVIRAQPGNNETNWTLLLPAPPDMGAEDFFQAVKLAEATTKQPTEQTSSASWLNAEVEDLLREMKGDALAAFGLLTAMPIYNGRSRLSAPDNLHVRVDTKAIQGDHLEEFVSLMVRIGVLRTVGNTPRTVWTGNEVLELVRERYEEVLLLLGEMGIDIVTEVDGEVEETPPTEVIEVAETELVLLTNADEVMDEPLPPEAPTPEWLTKELARLHAELERCNGPLAALDEGLVKKKTFLDAEREMQAQNAWSLNQARSQLEALQKRIENLVCGEE